MSCHAKLFHSCWFGVLCPGRNSIRGRSVCGRQSAEYLWLIAEDFSPDLGCYGTQQVWTPNLEPPGRQGVRYTRFFTTAPVCSASRSAFMTGMYQTTIGAHNHRSHRDDGYKLPTACGCSPTGCATPVLSPPICASFPSRFGFRGTGKTDWNFTMRASRSTRTSWTDLKAHQPFFAQINFQETHRAFHAPAKADPAKVVIPPYYPDIR